MNTKVKTMVVYLLIVINYCYVFLQVPLKVDQEIKVKILYKGKDPQLPFDCHEF